MKRTFIILFLLIDFSALAQLSRINDLNLKSFTIRAKSTSKDLELISEAYRNHPEIGINPFNSPPCENCIELIEKRDATSRYFIKYGTKGSHFFQQSSLGAINYKDENGWWREINYRLEPQASRNKFFQAANQPTPVSIDLNSHDVTISFGSNVLHINKHLEMYVETLEGNKISLGNGNWENYSAGDDGIRIYDFYPGIDVVFSLKQGEIETSFILKKALSYTSGYLVMKQEVVFPDGMHFNLENESLISKGIHADVEVVNAERVPLFTFEKSYAFDNHSSPNRMELNSRVVNNSQFLVYTPLSWLQDPATQYPVVIDPIVTTSNTLPIASIAGTKFSAVCWTNSCDYNLSVPTPANSTITGIFSSFEYFAGGSCFAEDGGFSIDFGTCHFPTAAPGVITCALASSPFTCGIVNSSTFPDFQACIPAPQCAPHNLDFVLHFYRCNNDPSGVCGAACVRASQPWLMTVEGRTLEISFNSPNWNVCEGDYVDLIVIPDYGVPPYTYLWTPGSVNNDTLHFIPSTSGNYTTTVTDQCGITASGTMTVTVAQNNNPGFTINSLPVCVNQQLTLNGNGVGPASDYDWIMPGSNAPGGIVNDNQSPAIQYSLPGNYDITLQYFDGAFCTFDSTISITVNAQSSATVSVVTVPASTICPGDTMHFYATPVNGGSNPTYDWIVDGTQVQTGTKDSLYYNNLINGSLVRVVLHSNSTCASPSIDTASVFVSVSNAAVPQVSINAISPVCPGEAVSFSTVPTNGGATPTYQWTVNGVVVAGVTGPTYARTLNLPDSIIAVTMTTSLNCVVTTTAIDSIQIQYTSPVVPTASIAALPNGAVCVGDSIQYTAHAVNGGVTPVFQWYVNGVPVGVPSGDSTFVRNNPLNNDSISVLVTTSATCVTSTTATSYSIVSVTPSVAPVVTVNALPSSAICESDTITFNASTTGAGSSPTFAWYVNGFLQPVTDSVFASHSLSNHDTIRVIVTSSLTCATVPRDSDFIVATVTSLVAPAITVAAAGNALCQGDSIHMVATFANGGVAPMFQWTQNGLNVGGNNDSLSVPGNDGDIFQATLTSSIACVTSSVVQSNSITANLIPYTTPSVSIVSITGDTICVGQSVTFSSATQNGGTLPTYQWYVNGIASGNGSNVFTGNSFQQGDVIQLVMTSNASCITQNGDTSNQVQIFSRPPLSVLLNGIGNQCPGSPVTLTANGSGGDGGPYSYIWTNSVVSTNMITVFPASTSYYPVTIRDNCGSTPASDSVLINVLPGPISEYYYSPTEPTSFNNTVNFIDQSQNAISWTWNFNDGDSSLIRNPSHTFVMPGTYDVSLITRSNTGCYDTIVYRVIVKEDIAVYFPSAFTPNADDQNETWKPFGFSLVDYEFTIWDRWGEKIFTGSPGIPWDGSVNGSSTPAHDGVYIFQVDLKDSKFENQVVTGRVSLIR